MVSPGNKSIRSSVINYKRKHAVQANDKFGPVIQVAFEQYFRIRLCRKLNSQAPQFATQLNVVINLPVEDHRDIRPGHGLRAGLNINDR